MQSISSHHKKSEQGHSLALFGLAIAAFATILGLVTSNIFPTENARRAGLNATYITQATLQQAADEAAWTASGLFKRNYMTTNAMQDAVTGVLVSYGIQQTQSLFVETCETIAAEHGFSFVGMINNLAELISIDPVVCTNPLKKIVRVRVTAAVEPDGLPVTVESISQAPDVDVILAIDTSDSMTYGWPNDPQTGQSRDPSFCNADDPDGLLSGDGIDGSCLPFQDVKRAANLFAQNLYFPYDRLGIVTFDRNPMMRLELSTDPALISTTILHLHTFDSNRCPYDIDTPPYATGNRVDGVALTDPDFIPCRVYNYNNNYQYTDCSTYWGPTPDARQCMITNIADGAALAGSILSGNYPNDPNLSSRTMPADGWPVVRPDSLPVLVLLSDGAANTGHDNNGNALCPSAEDSYAWAEFPNMHPLCRDANTLVRHCWQASDTSCMNASFPTGTTSTVNQALYDGDDRARDMFDLLAANSALVFTVGMGDTQNGTQPRVDVNGIAPGETLLKYGAFGTYTHMTDPNALKGSYYYGTNASNLSDIFLQIADQLIVNRTPALPQVATPSPIPTKTFTVTPTPTITFTPAITSTPTVTRSKTATATKTITRTKTPTPTLTGSVTFTPTITLTPTVTKTITMTPTITMTDIISATPTGTETITPTIAKSATPTRTPTATAATLIFTSVAAQDGWVLESGENSNTGGSLNSTASTFQLGDDAANRQYRAVLSFNTASLPDNAAIQSAVLKIRYNSLVGMNPFTSLGNLWAQIRRGPLNNNSKLESADFNAPLSVSNIVGVFNGPANNWYSASLTALGRGYINAVGLTQFRLGFSTDDNNNHRADFIKFISGNISSGQPTLTIIYTVP